MDVDGDGDIPMSGMQTQFTQSLFLFVRLLPSYLYAPNIAFRASQSQTQSGTKYNAHLTRFYARLPPAPLLQAIEQSLLTLGVRCKPPSNLPSPETEEWTNLKRVAMKIGGYDRRKEMFKGYVEVESFSHGFLEGGSLVVMKRDQVSPLCFLSSLGGGDQDTDVYLC